MLPFIIYGTVFMAFTSFAVAREVDMSWVQEILKTQETNKDKNRQAAYEIIQSASENGSESLVEDESNQKVCKSTVATLENKGSENRYPQLLVFVSFSMPMEALKALGHQTNKVGGKLVFRGLVDGSFPATSKKMQELGVDALIDPTLFEDYKINVCPVFLLSEKPLKITEEKPAFDQLTGHVSLHHALEMFAKNSNVKAASLLQDLKGGSK